MKKFIEFIKEGKGLLNSLSDKLLKEKLDSFVMIKHLNYLDQINLESIFLLVRYVLKD